MDQRYRGSCMCGAVQFSFSGQPLFVKDCVCESCRRAHGASAVCWVGVSTPRFTIDSGADQLRWYESSPASERGFCETCGTRMLFRSRLWPGETHMAVACMTPPHDLQADGISFVEELAEWSAMVPKGTQ